MKPCPIYTAVGRATYCPLPDFPNRLPQCRAQRKETRPTYKAGPSHLAGALIGVSGQRNSGVEQGQGQ